MKMKVGEVVGKRIGRFAVLAERATTQTVEISVLVGTTSIRLYGDFPNQWEASLAKWTEAKIVERLRRDLYYGEKKIERLQQQIALIGSDLKSIESTLAEIENEKPACEMCGEADDEVVEDVLGHYHPACNKAARSRSLLDNGFEVE